MKKTALQLPLRSRFSPVYLAVCLGLTFVGGFGVVIHTAFAEVKPTLVNGGFESDDPGPINHPQGWLFAQHAGEKSFQSTIDREVVHQGKQSLLIERIGLEPFGSLTQTIRAEAWRGKKIRFSGWIRAQDVLPHFEHAGLGDKAGAGLLVQITQSLGFLGSQDLFVDDMANRIIQGTQDWKKYVIEATVDPKASAILLGVTLTGKGKIWVDEFTLEEVTTEVQPESKPKPKPSGFSNSRNHHYRTRILLEEKESKRLPGEDRSTE